MPLRQTYASPAANNVCCGVPLLKRWMISGEISAARLAVAGDDHRVCVGHRDHLVEERQRVVLEHGPRHLHLGLPRCRGSGGKRRGAGGEGVDPYDLPLGVEQGTTGSVPRAQFTNEDALFTGFGSCSFSEPVEDLRGLRIL